MEVEDYQYCPIEKLFDGLFHIFLLFPYRLLIELKNTFNQPERLYGYLVVGKGI